MLHFRTRFIVLGIGACLSTATSLAFAAEPQDVGMSLVLSPRSSKDTRVDASVLSKGLARAAERFGACSPRLDADLAAAAPGDLVARCPARISTRCLAEAARKVGARRTLTGIVERAGEGYTVKLRVIDAESTETVAVRDARIFPARGDSVDLLVAGECLGLDALWSSVGIDGALNEHPCGDRVFATSWSDRDFYGLNQEADTEDLWLTVVPDAEGRHRYTEQNSVLAGAFASSMAVTIVGAAAASLLLVQSVLSEQEAGAVASQNAQAFVFDGDRAVVVDELDPAVGRFRELSERSQLESFAAFGTATAAFVALLSAFTIYQIADIPGRYESYANQDINPEASDAIAVIKN